MSHVHPIRYPPIQILILNLMPLERGDRASASAFPFQHTAAGRCHLYGSTEHEAKNTSVSHLNKFYQTFPELKNNKYDGMIITGAPVEQMNSKR